jgi:shikimate kinase
MRIYIVGFMGAGKTTVGQALAERIRYPFVDLDEEIERIEGRTVKEIFQESGEGYFRRLEQDVLRSTRQREQVVVATGGGTFTVEENIACISGQGIAIHLAVPFATIVQRIGGKSATRPLFPDETAAYELFSQRIRYYRRADLSIEVSADETTGELVERILLALPHLVSSPAIGEKGPGR